MKQPCAFSYQPGGVPPGGEPPGGEPPGGEPLSEVGHTSGAPPDRPMNKLMVKRIRTTEARRRPPDRPMNKLMADG